MIQVIMLVMKFVNIYSICRYQIYAYLRDYNCVRVRKQGVILCGFPKGTYFNCFIFPKILLVQKVGQL